MTSGMGADPPRTRSTRIRSAASTLSGPPISSSPMRPLQVPSSSPLAQSWAAKSPSSSPEVGWMWIHGSGRPDSRRFFHASTSAGHAGQEVVPPWKLSTMASLRAAAWAKARASSGSVI